MKKLADSEFSVLSHLSKKDTNLLDNLFKLLQIYIMTKTIDITPTWSALILPMVEVLKNPKADPQAKKEVQAELLRLAKIVDDQNEEAKKNG